jgi:hypothetical protein
MLKHLDQIVPRLLNLLLNPRREVPLQVEKPLWERLRLASRKSRECGGDVALSLVDPPGGGRFGGHHPRYGGRGLESFEVGGLAGALALEEGRAGKAFLVEMLKSGAHHDTDVLAGRSLAIDDLPGLNTCTGLLYVDHTL